MSICTPWICQYFTHFLLIVSVHIYTMEWRKLGKEQLHVYLWYANHCYIVLFSTEMLILYPLMCLLCFPNYLNDIEQIIQNMFLFTFLDSKSFLSQRVFSAPFLWATKRSAVLEHSEINTAAFDFQYSILYASGFLTRNLSNSIRFNVFLKI